jgi:hypothetical protein
MAWRAVKDPFAWQKSRKLWIKNILVIYYLLLKVGNGPSAPIVLAKTSSQGALRFISCRDLLSRQRVSTPRVAGTAECDGWISRLRLLRATGEVGRLHLDITLSWQAAADKLTTGVNYQRLPGCITVVPLTLSNLARMINSP